MGFTFVKLLTNEAVATSGGFAFKRLSAGEIPTFSPIFERGRLDLSTLGLKPGRYTITATALAEGLAESDRSNAVTYIVN